ncbi:ATP-binding protein [uncultured Parabacteroides sp.]|uniref:sensor histidine kinase n=1 Tax=uncultured Parabacteroides sp. TaxID=512312 RepID=UPI00260BB254|nr:ATP-binding protein [uncultured Parabacteroides sp.]
MEVDRYQLILDNAQVGWWEADFEERCYICSDYLISLLELDGPKILLADFLLLIREDYRDRIANEFAFFKGIGIYEQIFPMKTCYGYRFVRTKIYKREKAPDGKLTVLGILQLIPFSETEENRPVVNGQVDSVLRHLGSLSRALHSFIQTNDLHKSIHLALTEILFSIDTKGRVYIMEYGDEGLIGCTYEVCSEGIEPVRLSLQNIPVATLPWSTQKIRNLYPVLINNLDELPPEAAEEKRYLKVRGVCSLILIPLIIKGEPWGYMGIDIVDKYRMWSLEDYQWLSSISNIISIITKMARTNEALDHSEKLLRNIYTNIPVGIELYDKNGYLVDLNNMDAEIFGLPSKESALGINIFENPIIPDEVQKKLIRQEPVSFHLDYSFNTVKNDAYYPTVKSGTIDLFTKVSMLYDIHGDLINYMFINLDNTDKALAYNRIEEFEHFFSLVSRFAKVGYAKFDLLSRDGYAIDQWYQNLGEKEGTPLPEVIGVYNRIHPEDRRVMLNFFERVKKGRSDCIRKELRVKHGENWRWTRVNVMRNTQSTDPTKLEMICVNYDITELKETQMQREKAEELDRLKSAFLANMSHEIRTPLNAIVGFSTLLVDTDDPEEKKQFVEIIQKNNELLLQLISDVLDLAKIESGIIELKLVEVDLRELCKELVVSMRIKVPAEVALCVAPDLPFCIMRCDKVRLTQIISNFINNAIKHTNRGTIVLGYEVRQDEIEFSVTDTGDGMSPEVQQHVFDRFYKGNSFKQGTGLGLSICKSIIEQVGGRIGVESEEGKGSRFWFTLPH